MSQTYRPRRSQPPYTARLLDDSRSIAARRLKRDRAERRQRARQALAAQLGFTWLRLKADAKRHSRAIATHAAIAAASFALALLIAVQPVLDAVR